MTTESTEVGGGVKSPPTTTAPSILTANPVVTLASESQGLMGERILDVRDFSVDYGWGEKAVRAVDGVDVHIDRSKVLGIAGESGSGKSTLVYAITRLLRAPGVIAGGEARFNLGPSEEGERVIDLVQASEKELRSVRWSDISIVLQSALSALNPVVRVGSQFEQVLKTHRREMSKRERRARSAELMEMVGLSEDRLDRYPHELSGGQRQRIMIALALALDPQLVIMDEPTTALDVVTQREIISELFELRSRFGFAMIFITHDLSLLTELADEIVVMYAGVLVERATSRELYEAPRHPYTLGLLNSFPPMHGDRTELSGIPGSPPDLANLPTGCSFHPRCPFAMARCSNETPSLVEIEASGRSVACWLHVGDAGVVVPVELSRATLSNASTSEPVSKVAS
ncbi:MAG: ABC transporter ATP-binding protein [Acidimicrobiales bacterium]|jgi:peptide/nickel transport system ATP-binding protein